jgi:hypothetical protein
VFNRFIAYRDKKVVGVFVRFRAASLWLTVLPVAAVLVAASAISGVGVRIERGGVHS